MKTKLTEMFGIEYPIVQSGMQWLAVPQLAAAVCNAGGIGTINVTCWPTLDEFADALDEMNSLTNKPYIVNISLAPTQRLDNEEIRKTIRLCGEKHVAAIETSAEDPREFIADIKSAGMRHFHKCPNYKVSMSMERKGLDGVIIAGCHPGDCHYSTGNYYARRRMALLFSMLDYIGVEHGRTRVEWVSAAEGVKFSQTMNEFVAKITSLGKNVRLEDLRCRK